MKFKRNYIFFSKFNFNWNCHYKIFITNHFSGYIWLKTKKMAFKNRVLTAHALPPSSLFYLSCTVFSSKFLFCYKFPDYEMNSCSVMRGGIEFQKETATTLIHREPLRDLAWSFFQGWNFYDINGWSINLFWPEIDNIEIKVR